MAERPRKILICSCEDTMPLDADAVRRACRGAEVIDRPPSLPRRARALPRRVAGDGDRSPSPARRKRRCSPRSPPRPSAARITFVNIRETAGWSKDANDAGPKMAALIAAAAEPVPDYPLVSLVERRRDADLRPRRARDRSRRSCSKDHLDVTVLIKPPADAAAAARHRIPGGQGHDPHRQGPSRRVRTDDRRLCRAGAVLARRACISAPPRNGAVIALRHPARSVRRRAAVSRRRSARRLSARRSRRSGGGAARGAQGARSRRQLRQAALHRLHRRSVRAFALEDRRLPPLPRSLPDRRDRAGRRPCRDRRRRSAPAAANAPPPARPARRPTRCRRRTRCCASCARCSPTYREAGGARAGAAVARRRARRRA